MISHENHRRYVPPPRPVGAQPERKKDDREEPPDEAAEQVSRLCGGDRRAGYARDHCDRHRRHRPPQCHGRQSDGRDFGVRGGEHRRRDFRGDKGGEIRHGKLYKGIWGQET